MAAIIDQKPDWDELINWTEPKLDLVWTVINTDDSDEVNELIKTTIPGFVECEAGRTDAGGTGLGVLWLNDIKKKNLGGVWRIEVTYGKDPARQAGLVKFSADSGGEMVHITQSLETINSWAIDANDDFVAPEDYKGAIGVNGKEVTGTDIPAKGGKFTVTVLYGQEQLRRGYCATLRRLRGAMNDGIVFFNYKGQQWGWQRGELQFFDWHISDPGTNLIEISYTFKESVNITQDDHLTIGLIPRSGDIPPFIEKLGHDVLWVKYRELAGARAFLKVPEQINVERVVKLIDFVATFLGVFTGVDPDGNQTGTGAGPNDWCDGQIDDDGVLQVLRADVSSPMGNFSTLPVTFNFTAMNVGAGHGYESVNLIVGGVLHHFNIISEAGVPVLSLDDGTFSTTVAAGYTITSPLSGHFLVDDSGGNSCRIDITEP